MNTESIPILMSTLSRALEISGSSLLVSPTLSRPQTTLQRGLSSFWSVPIAFFADVGLIFMIYLTRYLTRAISVKITPSWYEHSFPMSRMTF